MTSCYTGSTCSIICINYKWSHIWPVANNSLRWTNHKAFFAVTTLETFKYSNNNTSHKTLLSYSSFFIFIKSNVKFDFDLL